MRVEGVRRALDLVESEGQADFGAEPHQIVVNRFQPSVSAEFPLHVFGPVEPALGDGRVELVGPPAHRYRLALLGDGRLQAPFAEVAPRADDVAHDVDGQRVVRLGHAALPPSPLFAPPCAVAASTRKPPQAGALTKTVGGPPAAAPKAGAVEASAQERMSDEIRPLASAPAA